MWRVIATFALLFGSVTALSARREYPDIEQVRTAFVPGGMCVSWTQHTKPTTRVAVAYGRAATDLSGEREGACTTYGTSYFCNVVLHSLDAYATYHYSIVGAGWTSTNAFLTARAAGDRAPATTLVVGDLGLANAKDTIQHMIDAVDSVDFMLHLGDLSYADDFYLRGDTYEGSWDDVGSCVICFRVLNK
jgi:hypothetical protein